MSLTADHTNRYLLLRIACQRSLYIALAFLLTIEICGLSGCRRSDGISRAIVEGTITFQDQPIEDGAIFFIPAPGVKGPSIQLYIKDGKYNSATDVSDSRGVTVGLNSVQILGNRPSGKMTKNPDNTTSEEVLQFVPPKYNEQTELQVEIKEGKNTFDFHLK